MKDFPTNLLTYLKGRGMANFRDKYDGLPKFCRICLVPTTH